MRRGGGKLPLTGVCLSSDGSKAFACSKDGIVEEFAIEKDTRRTLFSRSREVKRSELFAIAVSHDDKLLAFGGNTNLVQVGRRQARARVMRARCGLIVIVALSFFFFCCPGPRHPLEPDRVLLSWAPQRHREPRISTGHVRAFQRELRPYHQNLVAF